MVDQEAESSPAEVGWTAWPAAESPLRTLGLAGAVIVFSGLAGLLGGDLLWGVTAAVLLGLGLNRWFLPTVYVLDSERIVAGYPLRRRSLRWSDARRLVLDPVGGWMSDARRGRAGRRGLDLYWGPDPERARRLVESYARSAVAAGTDLEIVVAADSEDST